MPSADRSFDRHLPRKEFAMFKALIKISTAHVIAIDGKTVVSGKIGSRLTKNHFLTEEVAQRWFDLLKGESIWWEADIPAENGLEFEHLMQLVGRVLSTRMLLVTDSVQLMNCLWEVLFAFGARDLIEYRKDAEQHLALEVTSATPWHIRLGNRLSQAFHEALDSFKAALA